MEGGALQINITSLCGEYPQCSGHTGFVPTHAVCAFRVYTAQAPSRLLYRERALSCVHFPGLSCSGSGSGYSTKVQTRLCLRFVPSPCEQLRQPGTWQAHSPQVQWALSSPCPSLKFPGAPGPGFLVSPLRSWCLAATLPADVNHPESQKSLVRDWKPVCSLVGDAVSGTEFAPFPSPLPPASGGRWASLQLASSSLVLLSSFLLWMC